jgi:hypothetical protein
LAQKAQGWWPLSARMVPATEEGLSSVAERVATPALEEEMRRSQRWDARPKSPVAVEEVGEASCPNWVGRPPAVEAEVYFWAPPVPYSPAENPAV